MSKSGRILIIVTSIYTILCLSIYFLLERPYQQYLVKERPRKVDLESILDKESFSIEEYKTIFLQTGLGKSAIDKLKNEDLDYKNTILKYQEDMNKDYKVKSRQLSCIITCEDYCVDENGDLVLSPEFADLEVGDIIISMSTHTLGWHHGHAGIVVDNNEILESFSIGTEASLTESLAWRRYNNYVILRIKNISKDKKEDICGSIKEKLLGTKYKITAGIFKNKLENIDDEDFGTYCSYLPWFIWKKYGVDLDSDGGKIVTPEDLILSDKVEIVQIYGLNPKCFIDREN